MAQPTYEYSGVCYTATSGQTTFALTSTAGNPIGYLSPTHIHVRTSTDSGESWDNLVASTDWTFADPATSIVLKKAAAKDEWVDIRRKTPIDEDWVDFQSGSLLTAEQLNEAETFSLYCDQELADGIVDITPSEIGLDSTDDLPEGSINLYYTDARVGAYVSTNAVTKIIAGSNVGISPGTGKGEVTINASGGSGSGIPDAPLDGLTYGRKDAAWINISSDTPVQSDWNVTDSLSLAYIKNKPSWTQSDWAETDSASFAFIKNKPTFDLQGVCDEGSVTTTTIQAAGYRIDTLPSLP